MYAHVRNVMNTLHMHYYLNWVIFPKEYSREGGLAMG
jgi:hypothetical protein